MSSNNTQFSLSPAQTAELRSLSDASQFPAAYKYVERLVRDQIPTAGDTARRDLETTATWLDRAASINGSDGSFSSEFVRGATRAAGTLTGLQSVKNDFKWSRTSSRGML